MMTANVRSMMPQAWTAMNNSRLVQVVQDLEGSDSIPSAILSGVVLVERAGPEDSRDLGTSMICSRNSSSSSP